MQKTTDYSGGFVYENSTLAYFGMPEGRVRNNSGTLKSEYMITDHQGNVRVSFEDNGSGVAVVKQENSYYPFGLILSGSGVPTPTAANKNLYNGASEWQNDFGDLPDYYNTFYRNYDAAIGRFVGVDPLAEAADSWTTYQYGYNSPGMFNDPMGDYVAGRMPRQDYSNGIYANSDNYQPMSQMDAYAWGYTQQFLTDSYYSWSGKYEDYINTNNYINSKGINIYHAGDGTSADPHRGMDFSSLKGYLNYAAETGNFGDKLGSRFYYGLSVIGIQGVANVIQGYINIAAKQSELGEASPNSLYTMRDNNVNWKTLYKEFLEGTGPKYSGFGATHPMTKDMQQSFVVAEARYHFMTNGSRTMIRWDAKFGFYGLQLSGKNMTSQFVGGARVSIIPTQFGLMFIVDNTTDKESYLGHVGHSEARIPGQNTPQGTIYQKFIWMEPYR